MFVFVFVSVSVCVCVWVLSMEASCCLPIQLRFMTIDQAMYWIYRSTKYIGKPFITAEL